VAPVVFVLPPPRRERAAADVQQGRARTGRPRGR
jgi:hypothetical protein